ncbi:MAG: hypothetical protein WA110_00425 [Anaerolineaceae bacterium]
MKKFLLSVAEVVAFVAVVLGLIFLFKNVSRQPSVILTSTECDPPCWYGIEPGQTNSSQILEKLDNIEGIEITSLTSNYDNNDNLEYIYWVFERPTVDSIGTIYFKDDQVSAIAILTVDSLNLNELLTKLGEPGQYWTEIEYGENRKYLDVFFLYPTQGYLAEVLLDIEYGENQVIIQEETPVFKVAYFAPQMFQELWGTRILIDKEVNTRTGTFIPWEGYGSILIEPK